MQLLQVLQKASSLETLQDDGVAGGQADAGPAREEGGAKGHVRLISIYKYASGHEVMCSCSPSVHPHTGVHREISVREEVLSSTLITT